jgi:hypothetical protein
MEDGAMTINSSFCFIQALMAGVLLPMEAKYEPMVLNCGVEEGGPKDGNDIQILIDMDQKIVVYNYQMIKHGKIENGRYIVKFKVEGQPEGSASEEQALDMSMKISIDTKDFLQADDVGGAIIITKHDARFVKAYVTPVQGNDGRWIALGNVHWGKCNQSPF